MGPRARRRLGVRDTNWVSDGSDVLEKNEARKEWKKGTESVVGWDF